MAVNTNIYSQFAPDATPVESPLNAMAKASVVQESRQKAQDNMRSAQEDAQIRQVLQQSGDDLDGAIQKVYAINPTKAGKMQETIDQSRKAQVELSNLKIDHIKKVSDLAAQSLTGLYDPKDPSTWGHAQAALAATYAAGGMPLPDEYKGPAPDQATLDRWLLSKASVDKQLDAKKKHYEKDASFSIPGQENPLGAFDPETGQRMVQSPDGQMVPAVGATGKEAPEKAGSDYHQYAVRWAKEHGTTFDALTTKQEQQARKEYGQADDRPRVSVSVAGGGSGISDVKESVAGMKDGTLPPILPGRATKEYLATMAEAHRQGFNIAKAAEDWTATQKYLGTLNSNQQTTLRQSVDMVKGAVPIVRSLVNQWDSMGLPYLSAANLKLAMSGAKGKEAQSLAVRLEGQIADMTSALGTVYKGGNSSTDQSLALAAKNLQGDWSKKAALDALDQIEVNVGLRDHSMRLGPVANEGNQYAPNLSGVPSGVSSLLGSQKPGKYTLSDGSKWIKAQDGTISQAQ